MVHSVLYYDMRNFSSRWIGLQMFYFVLLLNTQVKSSTYYVSPTFNDGWCPDISMCFNLSEIATNITDSNVSVILKPGNHSLVSNLILTGLAKFSLKSEDHHVPAIIKCGRSSRLKFSFTSFIHIEGIIFNDCLDTKVTSIERFIIENSTFSVAKSSVYFGRALSVTSSTLIIIRSKFLSFQAGKKNGGAIYSSKCNVQIFQSIFMNNSALNGGVVYCQGSKFLIKRSSFMRNRAQTGGVLVLNNKRSATKKATDFIFQQYDYDNDTSIIRESSIAFIGSIFFKNTAKSKGGVLFSENCYGICILYLNQNNFTFNVANYGGVFRITTSNVLIIRKSIFLNNRARRIGGVGYAANSAITIIESFFNHSRAGHNAGALYFADHAKIAIYSGIFYNNTANIIGGSLYLTDKSEILLKGLILFELNSAQYSAVINVYESDIVCNGSLMIINNNGSIATAHSRGHFAGNLTLIDNKASLYFFDSDIIISGLMNSTRHNRFKKLEQDYTLQGGCLTLFISRVVISGTIVLTNSMATNGGGLLSITSRIFLDKNGRLNLINNTAADTGGGMYLYHSELYLKSPILLYGNKANKFGGGIHCISSTIVIIINRHNRNRVRLVLESNTANSGGGICLEANSKFYIKLLTSSISSEVAHYTKNDANFGGAIFVADNTTSSTCASRKEQSLTAASQSECFIQILRPIITNRNYPHIGDVFLFTNNSANISGAKLYGGLLDRCTVNAFGKNIHYSNITNSVDSIMNDTTSAPVRVCHCIPNSDTVNCSDMPQVKHFRKGSNLTLTLAAVDQLSHIVPATIHSSLYSRRGHLGDGQQTQRIEAACTDLNFSIISPLNYSDKLYLYAEGPCNSLGISSLKIKIRFIRCSCPIGFEPVTAIIDKCVCGCHHALQTIFPFIRDSDCDSETFLLTRSKDFWITANNQTFVSYQHCPSDYCYPPTTSVYIDFNISSGSDAQCAFDRTGVLCGSCRPNLTLSLGSSRCIECPHLWPAVTVAFTIGVFLAGLCLVALILTLNLTVAMGTLNATIFYANVLATNRQFFLPFDHLTLSLHNLLIAWLNLDVGFDICFFKGLNAYAKAWLQIVFPVYIIIIVVTVIIASHYSRRFAKLIARKNPVAALATLILLSYAKLLHSTIGILSYAILRYTPLDEKESFTKVVWLHDGSVPYLDGTHTPLFIVAVVIVVLGFIYTFLLFTWQWLVKFSNKAPFLWMKNTKLSSFIDAYHAPYMARNRYWTGLLLLARVILYLTAAINVSGEPSVNLLAILLIIGCISLLHAYSGISIYKRQISNILEFTTYFNILAFVAFKFYIQAAGGDHAVVAYTSISIQVAILLCSMVHHVTLEFCIIDKIKGTQWYKNHFSRDLCAPLLEPQVRYRAPCQTVTFSEVALQKPEELTSSGTEYE